MKYWLADFKSTLKPETSIHFWYCGRETKIFKAKHVVQSITWFRIDSTSININKPNQIFPSQWLEVDCNIFAHFYDIWFNNAIKAIYLLSTRLIVGDSQHMTSIKRMTFISLEWHFQWRDANWLECVLWFVLFGAFNFGFVFQNSFLSRL